MKKIAKAERDGAATRREFLKKSTLAAAAVTVAQNLFKAPVYGQNQAPSAGAVGANNKLVVGYIGLGVQGTAHMQQQQEHAKDNNIAQAAVCDLSAQRRLDSKKVIPDAKDYENFEELLGQKDIDAVTISTCDHWHAKAAMAALDAGKHVYLEKPMARYLGEAFALYEKVKSSGKTFQIGSQGCSDAKWARAAEMITKGKLGKLVLGQDSYMRNNDKGEWNTDPYLVRDWMKPGDLNWAKWQGAVKKKVDYSPEVYVRWRKFYPYCAGILGDLFPHRLHPLMKATGNPEFPSRVVCLGQTPVHSDLNDHDNGVLERDCPEDTQVIAEFPSGLALLMVAGTVSQYGLDSIMRGHKATLLMAGNRLELRPEKEFADDIDPETINDIQPVESIAEHEKNWFDCIRNSKTPNADVELAIRVQTVISLAEMANRLNMVCRFDAATRTITNGDGKVIPAISYGTLDKS